MIWNFVLYSKCRRDDCHPILWTVLRILLWMPKVVLLCHEKQLELYIRQYTRIYTIYTWWITGIIANTISALFTSVVSSSKFNFTIFAIFFTLTYFCYMSKLNPTYAPSFISVVNSPYSYKMYINKQLYKSSAIVFSVLTDQYIHGNVSYTVTDICRIPGQKYHGQLLWWK